MNPKSSRYYTYIRPIVRNKFARTYSSLVFSLITIAIFSFYAIRPTVTTILSLQKSIDEQTEVLNKVQDKVRTLSEGKNNYANIPASTKQKLENLVPSNPALPDLINSVTNISLASHATVSGIQFQTVELEPITNKISNTSSINSIEFSMSAQGGFADLMNLLTALKRTGRLVSISSINFIQPPDSALLMSITGKAYYLKN